MSHNTTKVVILNNEDYASSVLSFACQLEGVDVLIADNNFIRGHIGKNGEIILQSACVSCVIERLIVNRNNKPQKYLRLVSTVKNEKKDQEQD